MSNSIHISGTFHRDCEDSRSRGREPKTPMARRANSRTQGGSLRSLLVYPAAVRGGQLMFRERTRAEDYPALPFSRAETVENVPASAPARRRLRRASAQKRKAPSSAQRGRGRTGQEERSHPVPFSMTPARSDRPSPFGEGKHARPVPRHTVRTAHGRKKRPARPSERT